jgi:hypothetical protein
MTLQGEKSKMKTVRVLLFVAAMFGVVSSAFGGAEVITTVVTPLSSDVTYSTDATVSPPRPALVSSVGYTVSIANAGRNTINHVRFTGTTSVTDPDEKATFISADGASCTASADLTSIECEIGKLRSGESFPTFAVFFKAPVKVTNNGVADRVGKDRVTFSGITYYAEGEHGPKSKPQNSTTLWSAAAVTLLTSNPTFFKSAMPKSGGSFFTGDGAITTSTDPFAVAVTVPQAPTYSTVELRESDVSENRNCTSPSPNHNHNNHNNHNNHSNHSPSHNQSPGRFFNCYRAAITIPNVVFGSTSGNYLTIVLGVHQSNIKPGAKIGDVLIQYRDNADTHTYNADTNTYNVGLCASPTTPRADGIPCIAKAVHYKNKWVPGWTLELNGSFEFTLLNLKNGSFAMF